MTTMMDEQKKDEEQTLLGQLVSKAKRALGLEEEDSTASKVAKGAEQLQKVVKKSSGPERDEEGLLVGDSRDVIHENVRHLKSKGLSEDDAIKKAQAAANRKREKK